MQIDTVRLAGFTCLMALLSCSGTRPSNLGLVGHQLAPCPSTPNCVSSDATDEEHGIEAFALAAAPGQAWEAVRSVVAGLPRTTVVSETASYLHAECRSAIFRFTDDLELHLREKDGIIAVRSASRLGRRDFGVNRQRVEDLRSLLRQQGVLR